MAENETRIETLEDEVKVLKGEVKRTLVDLRALLMREDSPLAEGGFARRIAAPEPPAPKKEAPEVVTPTAAPAPVVQPEPAPVAVAPPAPVAAPAPPAPAPVPVPAAIPVPVAPQAITPPPQAYPVPGPGPGPAPGGFPFSPVAQAPPGPGPDLTGLAEQERRMADQERRIAEQERRMAQRERDMEESSRREHQSKSRKRVEEAEDAGEDEPPPTKSLSKKAKESKPEPEAGAGPGPELGPGPGPGPGFAPGKSAPLAAAVAIEEEDEEEDEKYQEAEELEIARVTPGLPGPSSLEPELPGPGLLGMKAPRVAPPSPNVPSSRAKPVKRMAPRQDNADWEQEEPEMELAELDDIDTQPIETASPTTGVNVYDEYWELLKETREMPASAETPGGPPLDVNLLSSLVHWTSVAKRRVGEQQLKDILELYIQSGHSRPELQELLLHISSMVEEVDSQPVEGPEQCVDLMFHLHGILTGGLPVVQIPQMEFAGRNGSEEDGES